MPVGVDDPPDAVPLGDTAVTVVVVDDQEPFRRAMRELIRATAGCRLVGEAASGEEAIGMVAELSPQVVIIDKRMPGIGGVEATRRLTSRHPGISVVLVSGEDPDPDVAASCGAAAFVRKQELSVVMLRELLEDLRLPGKR